MVSVLTKSLKKLKRCLGATLIVASLLLFQTMVLVHSHEHAKPQVHDCDICVQLAVGFGAVDSNTGAVQIPSYQPAVFLPVVVSTPFPFFFSPTARGPPHSVS